MDLKFKLNSFSIINAAVALGIILMGINLHFKVQNSYAQREFVKFLNEKMQKARIAEKAYLQFYEEQYVDTLSARMSEFKHDLETSDISAEFKKELTLQIGNYDSRFAKVIVLVKDEAKLTQDMLDKINVLNKEITWIYNELQTKEFTLQIEGSSLSPIEASLATVSRDATNAITMLRLTHSDLLHTGNIDVVQSCYNDLNKTIDSIYASLEMMTKQIKNKNYEKIGFEFKGKFKQIMKLLDSAKEILIQKKQIITELDSIGAKLNLTVDELLKQVLEANKKRINIVIGIIFSIIIISVLVSLAYAALLSKNIIGTIVQVVTFAEDVGKGNLNQQLKINQQDELGRLAISLNQMATNLAKHKKEQEANLTKLENILREVSSVSHQVANASGQMLVSSKTVLDGAATSASSITEITASLQQISIQTKINADNSTLAQEKANNTKILASQGNEKMRELVKAMENISKSSYEIAGVIKVINNIAEQTNLLALNAAIEAVRAGEVGRGFAVVADEIRKLAQSSTIAAQNTTKLIDHSNTTIKQGLITTKDTAEMFVNIVNVVHEVSEIMQQISMASQEQNQGISQVNVSMHQIEHITNENTGISQETAHAAEELTNQASKLKETIILAES